MTPQRLGLLVVEDATLFGRNAASDLRQLLATTPYPVFAQAAALADRGQLAEALRALGAPARIARAGAAWPLAIAPARTAVEQLPSTRSLRVDLRVLAAFCLAVTLVQLGIAAVLASKVVPAWTLIGASQQTDPRTPLLFLAPVQGMVWLCALLATRWKLSPWSRLLGDAQQAAIVASLLDAQAPAEVVSSWLASEPRLARPAVTNLLRAEDWRLLASSQASRAEAAMRTFLAGFRFVALALLVIQAGWMTHTMLVTLSLLPGAFL